MLSSENKIKLSEKILNSKTFQKAPKSSALLRYLVKSTIEEVFLKEGIIDLEFFGNKSDFDRSNPRVRVNMYNLRKKLNQYYEEEGKDENWKLNIEKGQYKVSFVKQSKKQSILDKINFIYLLPYGLLLMLTTTIIYNKYSHGYPEIWESFFSNNKQTTLIIGDVFGMKGKTMTGAPGWTRDYKINNLDQYYQLIKLKPELEKSTRPSSYSYASTMGVISCHYLTQLYSRFNTTFDIRFSTKTDVVDLKKGNIIYTGPLKNEDKFISLFNNYNSKVFISHDKIYLIDSFTKEKTFYKSVIAPKKNKDLAIISKFTGPSNNEYFLFFSNHDIGVKATVEHFTNIDSLAQFSKKHKIGNKDFTAVFVAEGKQRTNLKLKTMKVITF